MQQYDRYVHWVKNTQNNEWFDFLRLNLDSPYFTNRRGIYVIWYTSPIASTSKVIRLGQGDLVNRLREHRSDPSILSYSQYGQMKVTWAVVDNITLYENDLGGVEAYLADQYSPLVGQRFPLVSQISINLIGN